MGSRGRQSSNDLAIQVPEIEVSRRPDPPVELTVEQETEWMEVVGRLPADWFTRETHGLLIQYCRHVVAARKVAQLISSLENGKTIDIEEYDRLLKMQEREGRAISSLATRMRITQQATYDPKKKKGSAGQDKPWD